jgi:SAM-dependent methyltransferase
LPNTPDEKPGTIKEENQVEAVGKELTSPGDGKKKKKGKPTGAASGGKKSRKKRGHGPKSTDRHWLYQESVQSPDEHVKFFDRVYRRANGTLPKLLKEDFCGTAFLSAEWVRTRPDNVAVGVDTDDETLGWGRRHNIEPLQKEEKNRVFLHRADVRDVQEPRVDIVAALNFSYFGFYVREELRHYLECARRSLAPGGLLILDMFGGWEAQMEVTDKTRNSGFTYIWEQTAFDPISHRTRFYIHFKFHGGGGIKKAFVYDWRLWTMPEVRELLSEAGFEQVDIYWEGIDEDTDEGNGEFELVTEAENCPGWIAMLVAR